MEKINLSSQVQILDEAVFVSLILMPFGKAWIYLFLPKIWVNSRTYWIQNLNAFVQMHHISIICSSKKCVQSYTSLHHYKHIPYVVHLLKFSLVNDDHWIQWTNIIIMIIKSCVSLNSSCTITFTFKKILLGKVWTPLSSQLWVK